MKKYFFFFIVAIFLTACSPISQYGGIYDLRQPAGLHYGLGYVEASQNLDPDWYLDIWVQPEMKNGFPVGEPNFSLSPRAKKEVQVYFIEGKVKIFARAWIWSGSKRISVAKTKKLVQIEVRPVSNQAGVGWEAVLSPEDFGAQNWGSNRQFGLNDNWIDWRWW
jgi:hypothetical protein